MALGYKKENARMRIHSIPHVFLELNEFFMGIAVEKTLKK